MSDDPQLRELQIVFIDEAKQSLDDAEETLLKLESSGFDIELVNKAFRLAHNFKGSSRTVGYTELGRLAHKYEDILSAIKNNTQELTGAIISALLSCNDTLRQHILALQADPGHVVSIEQELAALIKSFSGGQRSSANTVASPVELDLSVGFGFFDDPPQPVVQKVAAKSPTKVPGVKTASPAQSTDDTLKIPSKRLDSLLNIIGELVVNQSILDDCRSRDETGGEMAKQAIGYMSKLIADIQSLSISLRLVPIKPLFQKLRRTARDISEATKKEINFVEEGDFCELDKGVIDRIADPLNHMIRNAVDHGIDSPEQRQKLGKSPVGTIRLSAVTQDDQVKIIVSDDGGGLNRERILAKAIANGIVAEGAVLTEQEINALIFAPGFSTKEQVTDVSGRGVGMEVVQRAVDELKGTIKIDSEMGKGTRFEISLPLSLSIIGGMVVQANGQRYIIPVSQLLETLELGKYKIETVTGTGRALNLRGEVLPVYNLTEMLGKKAMLGDPALDKKYREPTCRPAVVTQYRGKKVTFEVDQIVNQQKVVLKRLGKEFEGLPGIVAGAVLSNGEPGLVLSLDSLVEGMVK